MYEKIKQFINDFWMAIFAVLVCSCFALYCYGKFHDNRTGAESIGKQLESAGSSQREITNGLSNSTERARELREEISGTNRRIADIESDQRESGRIIADSKRILEDVRKRGQTK